MAILWYPATFFDDDFRMKTPRFRLIEASVFPMISTSRRAPNLSSPQHLPKSHGSAPQPWVPRIFGQRLVRFPGASEGCHGDNPICRWIHPWSIEHPGDLTSSLYYTHFTHLMGILIYTYNQFMKKTVQND